MSPSRMSGPLRSSQALALASQSPPGSISVLNFSHLAPRPLVVVTFSALVSRPGALLLSWVAFIVSSSLSAFWHLFPEPPLSLAITAKFPGLVPPAVSAGLPSLHQQSPAPRPHPEGPGDHLRSHLAPAAVGRLPGSPQSEAQQLLHRNQWSGAGGPLVRGGRPAEPPVIHFRMWTAGRGPRPR